MDQVKNNIDNSITDGNIINDDIQYYIDLFLSENEIDKKNIRPQEWTALLKYINETYIKPNKILLIFQDTIPYKRHNFFMINSLLDKYIYICNLYNQAITVLGFSTLSGITQDIIYKWENDKQKHIIYINKDGSIKNYNEMLSISKDGYDKMVTISPREIFKKLIENIELNINDMVIDGRRRGIGPVVRYNRFYEKRGRDTSGDVPRLEDHKELAAQLGIDTKLLEIKNNPG